MNDRKFIVMSADALVTEDLELLKTQPNYKRYVEGGARMESMLSVYPSVTYPAHTSMATGCLPGKTGILSNCEKLDPSADALPWVLDHKFVKVPDIFTAAKRAGRSTAAVFWPVTGNHPDIDYLINEWPGCAEDVPIERALASQGTSPEVMDIVRKYAREMPRTGIHPDCDYFIADCAAEIIRRHQPDLMMIHPANVDGARHGYGVFAKEVEDAVRDTDDMIGIVCRAAEAAGLKDKFNFILVSDHGQMDMKRVVNTNTLFADLGWFLRVSERPFGRKIQAGGRAHARGYREGRPVRVRGGARRERGARALRPVRGFFLRYRNGRLHGVRRRRVAPHAGALPRHERLPPGLGFARIYARKGTAACVLRERSVVQEELPRRPRQYLRSRADPRRRHGYTLPRLRRAGALGAFGEMTEELICVARILFAVALGFCIGFERKLRFKEAGVRTHTVVCAGAALMMVVSKYGFADIPEYDASRVAAQIVSGIGFLGAGMIIYRKQAVHGLTTAAGVWATAGVGMAAGGGLYIVALGSAAILIAVQCVLHLKCRLFTVKKYVRIRVCFEGESHCSEITALFGAEHFSKLSAERRDGAVLCTGTVTTAEDVTEAELADILAANEFIRSIERCDDE